MKLFNIFKSHWSKWEPFTLTIEDPSHNEYVQEDPPGLGGTHTVPAYHTDSRKVYIKMKRTNSKTGIVQFTDTYVGTWHKDKLPSFEYIKSQL